MSTGPPEVPLFTEADLETLPASHAWLMTSAVMLGFAEEGRTLAESDSPVAFRQAVHTKYLPQVDAREERVRRWKREHWTKAMFLTKVERIIMADLADYVKNEGLETENGLPFWLDLVRQDVEALRNSKGGPIPTWHYKDFYKAYEKVKNKPGRTDISLKATIESTFAELGLPFHLIGLTAQVVRPLKHLTRNLPLLPDTIGRGVDARPLLYALPAAALQIPPLRLGARFHVDAMQEDVFIGAPHKFVSLIQIAANSLYIRASATTTHPITLRFYMNQRWIRDDDDKDLPVTMMDGSSELVRNVVVHIPAQNFAKPSQVLIYIDSSDYVGTWNLEDLDQFEREIFLPNIDVESYYGKNDSEWRVVTRWKAYTNKEAHDSIVQALSDDIRAPLDHQDAKLYATHDMEPATKKKKETVMTTDLSRVYAYRTLPMQSGLTCTAYAFTIGAYLAQLTRDGDIITADKLSTDGYALRNRASELYEMLLQPGANTTSLPEGQIDIPGYPLLGARELPPLIASAYPYTSYTSERTVKYGFFGEDWTLSTLKDCVKKMPGRPGRLKQLIASICSSPYLRQYKKGGNGKIEIVTEPAFFLGFTRSGHTIMVFVAPMTRHLNRSEQIYTRQVSTFNGHRYFYFDSIESVAPEVPGSESTVEHPARLLSFGTLDELDAYFSLHGTSGNGGNLDMNMYVDSTERVERAYRRTFNEIIRHGFLPPHGDEPPKFQNWSMADWITQPLELLLGNKKTDEPKASPASTLTASFISGLTGF